VQFSGDVGEVGDSPILSCGMMHVVVYDIANERRLRRVASLCEDYGVRIEKSVFECELDAESYERFWSRLMALVSEEQDRVIAYPINQGDRAKIRSIGVYDRRDEGALVF